MPQVRVTVPAANLGPRHEKAPVLLLDDVVRFEGSDEARPTGTGFELVGGAEQRFTGYDIHVNTRPCGCPRIRF